jgi:hypothetical protein
MPSIQIPAFTGLNLRAAPHLLKPGEATWAHDCVLDSGAIVPQSWAGTTITSLPEGTKSYAYWNGAWQHSTTDRWYAESGQYLYWADGGTPGKQKVGGSPIRLGVPAPTTTPTAGFTSGEFPGVNFEGSDIQYVVTFIRTDGEESAPSFPVGSQIDRWGLFNTISDTQTDDIYLYTIAAFPSSGALLVDGEIIKYTSATPTKVEGSFTNNAVGLGGVTRGANGTPRKAHVRGTLASVCASSADLYNIPTAPAGDGVTGRKIYRLVGNEFRYVATIPDNTTTTYSDGQPASYYASAAILTSDDHDPPPNLTGLVGPHNGMLFGWIGKALRWSKVGNFDAWPEEYTFDDFPADITCAVPWGGFLAVFTPEGIYAISGSHPEALSRVKVQGTRGCSAPRSVVSVGFGLLYVSAFGVELFDGRASRSLSYDKLGERVVLTNPRTVFQGGRAYIYHSGANLNGVTRLNHCLVCDLRGGEPIWTTSGSQSVFSYVRPSDEALFILIGTTLVQIVPGGGNTWHYSTGLLDAQDARQGKLYSVLRLDAEGALTATPKVNDTTINVGDPPAAFAITTSGARTQHRKRMPAKRGERFSLDLTGSGKLYGLAVEYQ